MSTIENNLDLRCTLEIHVGGKLVMGAQVEYLGGFVAQSKVDPDFFSFYDFMSVIKEIGYSQEDNISVFYRLLNTDMNNGLVALTSHDEMLNMFATHSPGVRYFSIDMYVDCPNVVDSEDEEVIGRDTNTVDQGCLTELGFDLQVDEGHGGVDLGDTNTVDQGCLTELCQGWKGNVCPRIRRRVEKACKLMGECEVIYSGGRIFEVLTVLRTHVVDIGERTCTCRKWDVSGIPCSHGMAAIIQDKSDPLDYVDECFHVSTFAKIYNFIIKPIPDQTMWVHTEFDPIGPPPLRKKSGRPKKNRRKGLDEPKKPNGGVRKYYTTLKCSICKQPGHNARTCSQKTNSTTVDQECEVAMETTMVGGHEIEVAEETRANSGRGRGRGGRGRGGKIGRGGRGGKSARGGKTGTRSGAMVVGGTGRGGDPASKYDTIAPRGRGRGRGRGGTTAPLPGIVIREPNPNTRVEIGTDKGVNCGKGKQPIVCRGKTPITRFGAAPRVGLPAPQGWRRSTRMGNAIFWTQPQTSSAASCGSGGGSGSTTMPSTQPSSSTPSTQKSAS